MGKIVTISFVLEHMPGVLSSILDEIAKARGNILTINQNIPVQNMANVTISFETGNLNKNVEELLAIINKKDCVHKLEIIAQE